MPLCWVCHEAANFVTKIIDGSMDSSLLITIASNAFSSEPRHEKMSSGVSDQAKHKPACAVTEAS